MTIPSEHIQELKMICSEVLVCEEGGVAFILLRGLFLPDQCNKPQIDALLCPSPRDGYTCRLFFAERVSSAKPLNWNAVDIRILEKNWQAFSWKINQSNERPAQMVAAHLTAFR